MRMEKSLDSSDKPPAENVSDERRFSVPRAGGKTPIGAT